MNRPDIPDMSTWQTLRPGFAPSVPALPRSSPPQKNISSSVSVPSFHYSMFQRTFLRRVITSSRRTSRFFATNEKRVFGSNTAAKPSAAFLASSFALGASVALILLVKKYSSGIQTAFAQVFDMEKDTSSTGDAPAGDKLSASKLRKIAVEMKKGVESKDRTYHLVKYSNCFIASDAVAWLQNHLACPQDRAVQVGQQLCDAGFFKHVVDLDKPFANDYLFFRFYDVPTDDELRQLVSDDWIAACVKTMDLEQKGSEWNLEKEVANSLLEAKAWSRTVPGQDLKAFKVSVRSKAKMDALVTLLHDQMTERHGEWNPTYTKGRVLYKLDDDTNVQFWCYNPGAVLSKRDFVVVRRRVVNEDGSVIIVDRSVETGLRPEIDGYVRCDLPYNVRYIIPLKDKDGQPFTEIHYMNKTDIGGWIPKSVVNSANADVSVNELKHVVEICSK